MVLCICKMFLGRRVFSAILLPVIMVTGIAVGGEFRGPEGCSAVWDDHSLMIRNGLFTRTWRTDGKNLRTVVFGMEGAETFATSAVPVQAAGELSVVCRTFRLSPVGTESMECMVSVGGRTTRICVLPALAGIVRTTDWMDVADEPPAVKDYKATIDDGWALGGRYAENEDALWFTAPHVKITEYNLLDQTDVRDNLLHTHEWLTPAVELPERLFCSSLDVRNPVTGEGLVFLRLAPMPRSRPNDVPDFILDANFANSKLIPLANGYPIVELLYRGGDAGRITALHSVQRAYRPYRPGRDGVFVSNTWGGGNRDRRINEEFMRKEIAAGIELGVDVIQIDDGWQRGRTANSAKALPAGGKKTWGSYWAVDPDFWEPDPERFPRGLKPLVVEAKKGGIGLGLWFGPDTSDDAVNWEKDCTCLLDMFRRLNIRYFKLDSMHLPSALAYRRNRQMFDRMLEASDGSIVFDLDSTAQTRPGFFGAMDIGPIFVENRYAGSNYRPWATLSSIWQLAHVVDPLRLRMEVVDPDPQVKASDADDPLASVHWPLDAGFAIAMFASPLAWMELSEVAPARKAAMRPLVAMWRHERDRLYAGVTFPVGVRPDGFSWTGFVNRSLDGKGGYALLFRELDERPSFSLPLKPWFCGRSVPGVATVVGGRGSAVVRDDVLMVSVPLALDYIWVKLE